MCVDIWFSIFKVLLLNIIQNSCVIAVHVTSFDAMCVDIWFSIFKVLLGTCEHFVLANDTALVDELYPNLLQAFNFYKTNYNTSSWNLPFKVCA